MWSGGWESTLVQWSLNNTDQKDFIPRLGAAIVRLSISYDGNIIAVSHSDGVIHLVGLQRNILQTIKSVSLAAADSTNDRSPQDSESLFCFEPASRCLVLRGKPGSLQFYNPSGDRLESEIDVVEQNIVSSGLNNFTNGFVDSAVFSPSGSWLCTADSLVTKHIGSTINLKFWARDPASSKYILKTTVIDPHDGAPIRQMVIGNGSFLATLSDTDFKLWMILKQKTLNGTQDVWYCVGVGDFKEYKPTTAVFSADDRTIAVAFQHLVTFWNVDTSSLQDHALSLRRKTELISAMWYGFSNSDTFFTSTKSVVTVWNLSKRSILQTVDLETTCFDRVDSFVVLCGPRSINVLEEDKLTQSVYTHSLPETSSPITACCLVRKADVEKEAGVSEHMKSWLDEYSLFLLMANGEIAVVDQKTTGQHANKLYAPDPQATAFYRHLEIVRDPKTEEMNSMHVKPPAKNARELVDKLVGTPAYTLAPSRYFLGEQLNVLLKGTGPSSPPTDLQMDLDEAKEKDMDVGGDEPDVKIEESFRNQSTDIDTLDESSDSTVRLTTTTDFSFLRKGSALAEGKSKLKVSRSKSDSMNSAFSTMSALYQSLRSE
ncbi:hypothetical protein RvY_01375-1 [Ramazzottius varieornatus]|uniref:WD repeat-containing protein 75 second beta-propeller domain-containing protein n=1 Tax=Ramazzottius varieornatus TaxID=947166 RepID=A0A1D1UGG4_RAMVA|nr:hypothetical protein RvY_01375-1 [Ramazzottius varieornatus]